MKITVTRHAKIGRKEETKTATIEIPDDAGPDDPEAMESAEQKAVRISYNLFHSMDRELTIQQ